jgi:very-short-patch-repair endonuclease
LKLTKKKEIFIEEANKTHGKIYDYSKVIYKRHNQKVIIICSIHGEFEQTPHSHINGCGCPRCLKSRGHKKIALFLEENNIFFKEEKKFKDCINLKTGYKLIFDFYLPDYNICIEFDGKQHFVANNFFGGEKELQNSQYKDSLKTSFCEKNNLNLIRIPFNEEDNINNILKNKLYGK